MWTAVGTFSISHKKIIATTFRTTSFQHDVFQYIKSQKIFLNIRSSVVTTYCNFHRCSNSMRSSILHALWTLAGFLSIVTQL